MNDVKLTDFTADQLQKLLVAVAMEQAASSIFGKGEDEDMKLWQVQILNAISTVKMRAIPEQN